MKKSIILLAAAAFLSAGCEKITNSAAAEKKMAVAKEAAELATAKVAARLEGGASAAENPGAALAALTGLLCASPKLMEDIEGNMDLINALSGEGGDREEMKRQIQSFQRRYREALEKGLAARGSNYAEFCGLAGQMSPGSATQEQKQKFKALISEKCPLGDKILVEKTADGLMRYAAVRE